MIKLRFQLESAAFDYVILNLVFTHMLEPDFGRYLAEISRTLKKSTRGYITLFLLNQESCQLNAEEKNKYKRHLTPFRDNTMVYLQDLPENMIAFDETYAREVFKKNGSYAILSLATSVSD